MATIRKAVSAALAAALSVLFTGLATEIPRTQAGWVALVGAAAGAALTAGYLVYQTRNAPPTAVRPGVTERTGPAPY